MGYHVVDPSDIDPFDGPGRDFRPVGRAIGLDTLGVNVVEAAPGEQIPLAYHSHEKQEEGFYVVAGTLSVETPEETYEVDDGEFFFVEPNSPHRAFVPEDAAGPVEVVAFGAPSVDDVREYEA